MNPLPTRTNTLSLRVAYALGAVALVCLVVTAATSFNDIHTLFRNNDAVRRTQAVLAQLQKVVSTVTDAETGQRGALLTGREAYLEPYHSAVASVEDELAELKRLTADNAGQQKRITEMESQVAAKMAELATTVTAFRDQGRDAAIEIVKTGQGREWMDRIRRTAADVEAEEQDLLVERAAESRHSLQQTLYVLILALGSTLALLLAAAYLFHRNRAFEQAVAERLYAEREWLEVTLRSIGDAVIATDMRGNVLFLNAIAEDLTGYEDREAVGRPIGEVFRIVNENTRQPAEIPVEKVLRDRLVVGLANHTILIAKDGTEHPIDDSAAPIQSADGTVLGVVLVFRDFTERRRAEMALQQSLQELQDLFENSPVGIHLMAADGTILRVNRAESELLGCDAQEMVGQRAGEYCLSPEMFEELLSRLSRGETIDSYDLSVRAKDGSIKDVIVSANALEKDGKFVHSRSFTRDVTARKRAEDRLKFLAESGQTLGSLVDYRSTLQKVARLSVPFFADICVVDVMGEGSQPRRVAAAHYDPDKERLLAQLQEGYPLGGTSPAAPSADLRSGEPVLIAEVTADVLDRWARNANQRAILSELRPNSVLVVPFAGRSQLRGAMTFVQSASTRRFDQQDLDLARELAHRTTTALENAQLYQELRDADRRKDEFLAMLAHELRNPLAAIQYANALSRVSQVEADGIDCAAMIEKQVQQLKRLIDDLLDVSRITRDRIQLKQQILDARSIIQRAADAARPLLAARRHHFELELPNSALMVNADPARLEQMIVNLLANAAKYTPEEGRVDLRAYEDHGKVVIKVRDTGVGIAPQMLSQIFTLFMQVDPSLERTEGGLGIGLTVVRRLALLHGGDIEASSEGLGKGSEFTLSLPAVVDHVAVDQRTVARDMAPPRALHILVVEDNVDAARGMALLLGQLGHKVDVCHDGRSALAAALDARPDVVLLDLGLPGLDGYRLAEALRREPSMRDARLIAISGYGQEEDHRRSLAVGFDEHLVKPIDFAVLQGLLSTVSPENSRR